MSFFTRRSITSFLSLSISSIMILPTSAGMTIIFTLLCFPLLVFSSPISSGNFDHHKRVIAANSHSLAKRFDNARYTWYDITTGEYVTCLLRYYHSWINSLRTACGQWYQKSDYVSCLIRSTKQHTNSRLGCCTWRSSRCTFFCYAFVKIKLYLAIRWGWKLL